jgi:hypothetical protein
VLILCGVEKHGITQNLIEIDIIVLGFIIELFFEIQLGYK